jgi:uncharacterized protein (TIGR02996 family)
MNEEAGFIAAILDEPGNPTVLLVFADWLDERSDPRGEYLRLLTDVEPNRKRIAELEQRIGYDWVQLLASRWFSVGDLVRLAEDPGHRHGTIVDINPNRTAALVEFVGIGFFPRTAQPFTSLRRVGDSAKPPRKIRPVKSRRPARPRRPPRSEVD